MAICSVLSLFYVVCVVTAHGFILDMCIRTPRCSQSMRPEKFYFLSQRVRGIHCTFKISHSILHAKDKKFVEDEKFLDKRYNDDAFGLVFFTGFFFGDDSQIFCGTFAVLSFIAAWVNSKRFNTTIVERDIGQRFTKRIKAGGGSGNDSSAKKSNVISLAEKYLIPPVVAVNALFTSSLIASSSKVQALVMSITNVVMFSKGMDSDVPSEIVQIAITPVWSSYQVCSACLASCLYGLYKFQISRNQTTH